MIPTKEIYRVASFSLVPYLVMTLFTIPYFIHQKILISQRIKNIPATTIFSTDLSKVKKNLKIQSLIYNFIIIISSFEAIALLLSTTEYICSIFGLCQEYYLEETVENTNTNKSCEILYNTKLGVFFVASSSLVLLIPILVNLFLIVLRRAYLSVPYRRWIVGYSGYFLFRLVCIILTEFFLPTQHFKFLMELPFSLFDFCVYVNASKKFYLLLKGMSEEAKWHSTTQEYKRKKREAKVFGILRSIYLFTLTFGLIIVVMLSIENLTKITKNSSCLLQYVLPNTPINYFVPGNFITILYRINYYCRVIRSICTGIVGVIAFLSNLAILTSILVKLLRRRKKYIHVNEWITRPLMERYRADVERHIERRPPFIQAFRSQIIY